MSRPRSVETLAFRGAVGILLVHALDDAVVHRQPGVGLGQHAVAVLLAILTGGVAIAVFGRLRPGLRSAIAGALGVVALANGVMHVSHVRADTVAASDVTGVLAAVAGILLLGLAATIPFIHRGARAATAGRRWRNRALAAPAGLLALIFVVAPIATAVVDSHKWREPIPPTPHGYDSVTFDAEDGLRLHGWFHPSRNGATVLVVHGGNGDRRGALAHARLLERRGFGVLIYDARGRGQSDGSPSGYGWGWSKDVEGALDYVAGRADVDPARIGGLGLSTGADALLEVAADRPELAAVVTDGAAAMSWQDGRRLGGPPLEAAAGWVMFQAIDVLTGEPRPRVLQDRVAAMEAPLLLISAGRTAERDFNLLYERAAGGPVEHWNLPGTAHTRGLSDQPADYERRVAGFFESALHRNRKDSDSPLAQWRIAGDPSIAGTGLRVGRGVDAAP
jgi:dienelactone hydrolase